jgi:hypothetical protein
MWIKPIVILPHSCQPCIKMILQIHMLNKAKENHLTHLIVPSTELTISSDTLAKKKTHHCRQAKRDYTDKNGGAAVLDGDDLVVLAPDVFRYERLRVVMLYFMIAISYCNVCHPLVLPYSVLM